MCSRNWFTATNTNQVREVTDSEVVAEAGRVRLKRRRPMTAAEARAMQAASVKSRMKKKLKSRRRNAEE